MYTTKKSFIEEIKTAFQYDGLPPAESPYLT